MCSKLIWILFLSSFWFHNSQSGTITDCFYINNDTESMHLICEETKESYPKTDCWENYATDKLKVLKVLDVSSCRGSGLNADYFKKFTKLFVFDVSFFGVEYLEAEALNMKHLEKFNASHNKMTEIKSSIFTNTPELIEMDFSYNKINKLNVNSFEKVPKLTKIMLSNNIISTIEPNTFSHLGELSILDLGDNSIEAIDKDLFQGNTKLSELRLDNNPIKRFECDALVPFLEIIPSNVTLNQLEALDLSCVQNSLYILTNRENEIVLTTSNRTSGLRLGLDITKNLKLFNISGNHLKNTQQMITFLAPSIEKLDLSENFIGKINQKTFKDLDNLQYLNLGRTNLSNFGFHTFFHQKNLEVLDLSYNRLKKVDFSLLFRNFKNLETLNLEGNDLVEIDTVNRSNFPKLSFLGISKNRFSCEYLSTFLRQWDNIQVFHNPSDQTHIDGVDCIYDGQDVYSIEENEAKTTETMDITSISSEFISTADIESSTGASDFFNVSTDEFSTETTTFNDTMDEANTSTEDSDIVDIEEYKVPEPSDASTNYFAIELRVVECVLILLCVYFVVKTKAIQRIQRKVKRMSSEAENNVAYHQDKIGSQNAIVLFD